MNPDEPTDVMPGGPDEPTGLNSPAEQPTGRIPEGNEDPTDVIKESGTEPTEVQASPAPPGSESSGNRGIGVLIGAIVASLLLAGAYVAAGGPVGPDKAADPCDARAWTDPQNLEEAAQQFALSAADGAACELGVSREELTRSIADDQARQDFMDEHGFTESDLEDALRAGLNRAVDDAENAGVLGGLASAGIRAAIKVMPMSTMIDLLENADGIFNGDLSSLGGLGDAIEAITGGIGELGSGSGDDSLGGLGDALEGALPNGTTGDLDQILPQKDRKRLENQAKDKLKQSLDGLLGP